MRILAPALALALIGCGGSRPPPACHVVPVDGGSLRTFVVGHRQLITDGESYASYAASYRRHMDDIAACLHPTLPNLVAFPEGAGLVALAIGSRGEKARAATNSQLAFLQIIKAYATPARYYGVKYPAISPQRQVFLALSDVVWRAALQTFGGIARDYGVWVMANVDVARVERTDDPARVAALGDPDLPVSAGAFVAVDDKVYNSALLFAPSGEAVGRVDKVFLTDPEEQLLDLANGSFALLDNVQTPFARIAVAISRDAFYAPFMERVEDLGANLVVQPEAFSGWTIEEQKGDWLPDVFLASGWHHTQKHGGFRYNLTPQLTGNFFDLVFDGQPNVIEKARPAAGMNGFVGQQRTPGWVSIGPWAIEDPGVADTSLSLDARRQALRARGEELLPKSGSPHENQYAEGWIAADLRLDEPKVEVNGSAQPVAAATSRQRHPFVVASGGGALVVWQEGDAIAYATSADGGRSFSARATLATATARRPSACVAADGHVAIVWQSGAAGEERVMSASADAIGSPFTTAAAAMTSGPQWEPRCSFIDGRLAVVWTDLATGVPKILAAMRGTSETGFGEVIAADASNDGKPRLNGSQVQADLSGPHLVWLDYRDRSWDVRYARWDGAAFGASARIDGVTDTRERLHADPRVLADGDQVLVAFTDLHNRRGMADIGYVLSADGGQSWTNHATVPGGVEQVGELNAGGISLPRYRPAPVLWPNGFALFFQDLKPLKSSLFVSWVLGGGSGVQRADDTGAAEVSLTHPSAAWSDGAALLVWEDDRDGAMQIYATRVAP